MLSHFHNPKKIQKLEMRGITKIFGDTVANKDINLSIRSGEILGLLGENGAGKTTLMNILYGLYRPDKGTILINDSPVSFRSPADAISRGIGMVHQHFKLIQKHTVLENIALGYKEAPFFFPNRHVRRRLQHFEQTYALEIKPDSYVWQLSAGEQQRVEILKVLFMGADLLILDEPTSVLAPLEVEALFTILKRLSAEGHSIIFISHKLDEVLAICHRVAVLRQGKVVGAAQTKDIGKQTLATMMVGKEIPFQLTPDEISPGPVVLRVQKLHVTGERGQASVDGVSFEVCAGEVFGIAGVSGNGQQELVEAVTGLRRIEKGSITLSGQEIRQASPCTINSLGVSHIPEERIKYGTAPGLPLYENSILKQHKKGWFSKRFFMHLPSVKEHAKRIVEGFRVRVKSIDLPIKTLSGGNIQKLILGREITAEPSLLVASHPTYGLDVESAHYIRRKIQELKKKGVGILLVSEDLEELFQLSDRIGVMFRGRLMGVVSRNDFDLHQIGMMMTGTKTTTRPGVEDGLVHKD